MLKKTRLLSAIILATAGANTTITEADYVSGFANTVGYNLNLTFSSSLFAATFGDTGNFTIQASEIQTALNAGTLITKTAEIEIDSCSISPGENFGVNVTYSGDNSNLDYNDTTTDFTYKIAFKTKDGQQNIFDSNGSATFDFKTFQECRAGQKTKFDVVLTIDPDGFTTSDTKEVNETLTFEIIGGE